MTHITENERQGLADGTLDAAGAAKAAVHVAVCAACAADVSQLRILMHGLHDAASSSATLDEDLWPAIRARIAATKVIAIGASSRTPKSRAAFARRRAVWLGAVAVGSAAAAMIVAAVVLHPSRTPPVTPAVRLSPPSASTAMPAAVGSGRVPAVTRVSDSARAYQQEVQQLLDEIEMQRAMLGPSTTAAGDSDLQVIDHAIAELRTALERDPNNGVLRQLLAESYQQKLDLLRRLRNAS
ncbi:MAG: hypothetical protein ACREOJ_05885 [Gemmatimonadaceae bacterium]